MHFPSFALSVQQSSCLLGSIAEPAGQHAHSPLRHEPEQQSVSAVQSVYVSWQHLPFVHARPPQHWVAEEHALPSASRYVQTPPPSPPPPTFGPPPSTDASPVMGEAVGLSHPQPGAPITANATSADPPIANACARRSVKAISRLGVLTTRDPAYPDEDTCGRVDLVRMREDHCTEHAGPPADRVSCMYPCGP